MFNQSSLGNKKINRAPSFNEVHFAKVTSIKDYESYGKVEVILLDTSQPAPVWVSNDVDKEPVVGDFVIIGYIEGNKNTPYLVGFVKNKNWTTNFVSIKKEQIKIQMPVYLYENDGLTYSTNGLGYLDIQQNLTNSENQEQRATIELNPDELYVQMPFNMNRNPMKLSMKRKGLRGEVYDEETNGEIKLSLPLQNGEASIIMDENGIVFNHPTGNIIFNVPNGLVVINDQQ